MQRDPNLVGIKSTRRGALGLAGAALVGLLGGVLGRSSDAAAADQGSFVIGGENVSGGTAPTRLTATGTMPSSAAFEITGPNAQSAIHGSGRDIGVSGSGPIGVYGDGAVGGVFSGTDAAVSLTPAAAAGPPGGVAVKGDLMVDADGVLHLCVAAGSPGTWIPVSHGGIRPLAAPRRVFDSRLPANGPAFSPNSKRVVDIVGAEIGVPPRASAVIVNLTVTEPTDLGFLAAYPLGAFAQDVRPDVSNLNWGPGQTLANGATIRLGNGKVELYVERSWAHVIVDVTGYVL